MVVVLVSNFFNQHMEGLCDELSKLCVFYFIETERMPHSFINNGYLFESSKDYLVDGYSSLSNKNKAIQLINECDALIFGSCPKDMIAERLLNKDKISFRYSERIFKGTNNFNYFSLIRHPRSYLKSFVSAIMYHLNRKEFLLSASSYAKKDYNSIGKYIGKTFKRGYFPRNIDISFEDLWKIKNNQTANIIWIGRFIAWKHPEIFIKLMGNLKRKNIDFKATMIGSGPLKEEMVILSKKNNVNSNICFLENVPNNQVKQLLCKSNICVITSDYNEGWGCVLNEAMAAGCAVIVSSAIGAAHFLITSNNGLMYPWNSDRILLRKTINLLKNKDIQYKISKNAFYYINEVYSPKNAAVNLMKLIVHIKGDKKLSFKDGPCAKRH